MTMTDAANHRSAGLSDSVWRGDPTTRSGALVAIGSALAMTLLVLAAAHAGITIHRVRSALLAAAMLGLVNAGASPLLARLAMRRHLFLLPVGAFALNGLLLALLSRFLPGFDIYLAGVGALVVLALTAVHVVVALAIAANDAAAYDRFVIRPRAERDRRAVATAPGCSTSGLLFLEINGLAEPILREAIAGGHAPTVARWLGSGRHRLVGWECDLSSQISASQAGVLHGDNFEIPAFRWYDKATRTIVVSNHVDAGAATIEHQVANGRGLLAGDGACRGTLLSGDAVDRVLTCSAVDRRQPGHEERAIGELTLYGWARLATLLAWDLIVDAAYGIKHLPRGHRPATRRFGLRLLGRAFSTVILRELCVQTVIRDTICGVPTVYMTFAGYDAVAHHAGIRSPEALRALRGIDRQLARLESAGRYAARPYDVVVLSGHGQSPGLTFRQRYDQTLAQVVRELLPESTVLVERGEANEALDTAAALLAGYAGTETWYGKSISRIGRRSAMQGASTAESDAATRRPIDHQRAGAPDVIVLASGNLGLLSFPAWPHRLTLEEITARFPRLLVGLVNHDGIGFVLVTSARLGAVVLGATGTHYLDEERVEGEDPLAPFGPHAARHVRRQSLFTNTPDVLVNSRYDGTTGEVAAFEELAGSHGGLGGPQSQPFLLQPSSLRPDAGPLIGACAVYDLFARWRREIATVGAATPSGVERAG